MTTAAVFLPLIEMRFRRIAGTAGRRPSERDPSRPECVCRIGPEPEAPAWHRRLILAALCADSPLMLSVHVWN